jgi:hypothetical protein
MLLVDCSRANMAIVIKLNRLLHLQPEYMDDACTLALKYHIRRLPLNLNDDELTRERVPCRWPVLAPLIPQACTPVYLCAT